MTDFDINSKQISGPTNVVRLEGNVHGIKKVIYLFMDWHVPVEHQTECTNLFSKDVNKYFIDSFNEINKKSSLVYDFFMEIRPTEELVDKNMIEQSQKRKYLYIGQVLKLFTKLFEYDKEKNKVKIPKMFNNVRLHYLDVRDYFMNSMYYRLKKVDQMAFDFFVNYGFHFGYLNDSIELLKIVNTNLDFVINILESETYEEPKEKPIYIKPIEQEKMESMDIEMLKQLADKMRRRYNDEGIKKVMNRKLDGIVNDLKEFYKFINRAIEIFTEHRDFLPTTYDKLIKDQKNPYLFSYGISGYYKRSVLKQIYDISQTMIDEFIEIFARLTDIYFLRRFLDKNYITNAIVYSGGAHSETYVYTLVNDFDFNITHVAFSKFKNVDDLMKEIKFIDEKKYTPKELTGIFSPPELYQCSDITNFPNNFL